MINLKNILKVLLIALFVCAWSGDFWIGTAAAEPTGTETKTTTGNENKTKPEDAAKDAASTSKGGVNDASFCSGDLGIFKELVQTGQMIFNRLRDLIYVVAGFGIIAVAVGGFFGNLNWKWLGAIVISLVVIATAGELVALMTGCESFNGSLITNTLKNPTLMSEDEYVKQRDKYTTDYTVEVQSSGKISWDDSFDNADYYAGEGPAPRSEDEQLQETSDNSTTETSNSSTTEGKWVNPNGKYNQLLQNDKNPLDRMIEKNRDKYY